jgi:hypothetical protein
MGAIEMKKIQEEFRDATRKRRPAGDEILGRKKEKVK